MLIVALMSMMLMTALGSALVLMTLTEVTIAANYKDATEAFYAAEAAVEWALQDLEGVSDWDGLTTSMPYTDAPLDDMLPPGAAPSRMHVIVWVARPVETEDDPYAGLDVLVVLGHAYGTGGSHRAVEVTVAREAALATASNPIRVLYWREVT